jgi:hypothetical protein
LRDPRVLGWEWESNLPNENFCTSHRPSFTFTSYSRITSDSRYRKCKLNLPSGGRMSRRSSGCRIIYAVDTRYTICSFDKLDYHGAE